MHLSWRTLPLIEEEEENTALAPGGFELRTSRLRDSRSNHSATTTTAHQVRHGSRKNIIVLKCLWKANHHQESDPRHFFGHFGRLTFHLAEPICFPSGFGSFLIQFGFETISSSLLRPIKSLIRLLLNFRSCLNGKLLTGSRAIWAQQSVAKILLIWRNELFSAKGFCKERN